MGTPPGEGPWTASDLRKAWRALADSSLPPEELVLLRDKLRREWLARDLRSALIAWSDEGTLDDTDLLNTIREQLDGHEEELLDWIVAGDFGLDGREVLRFWADRVGRAKPEVMFRSIGKVPLEYREGILQTAFRWPMKEAEIDACVKEFAKLPDEALKASSWKAMLRGVLYNAAFNGGPDCFHELLSRDEVPDEAHRAALGFLAENISQSQQPTKSLEDFRKLSDEDKAAIGPELLEQAKKYGSAYSSNVTNALTMLAESGQWELIASKGPETLDRVFKSGNPNAEVISRWALALPGRDEVAETYRRAVAGRFRENLAGSTEWVRSLPEGWHREQALAQLAMTADLHHKNAPVRDEILAEIADPALQEKMREWRRTKAVAK